MVSESFYDSIFIIIPSYEDPSLISTIQGAIDMAANPDRISFGIGLQHKRVKIDMSIYPDMEIIEYDVDNRPGLMQVRNDLAALIGDRDYLLSIDAHMTFVKNWDINIIEDYLELQKITRNKKIAISCQMSKYDPPMLGEPCTCSIENPVGYHSLTRFNNKNPIDGEFSLFDNAAPKWVKTLHEDFSKVIYTSMDLFFVSRSYVENNKFFIDKLKMYNDEPLASYLLFMRGWTAYRSYKNVYAYHNANPYRFEVGKNFASNPDTIEDIHDCRMLMLYNSGPLAIESQINPADFYKEAGLYEHYLAITSNPKYKNTYL